MRISLLTTEALIAEWFAKDYEEVTVCAQADERFWEGECMIITAFYQIGDEYFHIFNLWEKYLRIRQDRKKLIILGWTEFAGENYLQVAKMPELSLTWARGAKRAGAGGEQKPTYPCLPDQDIVHVLGRVLHSHGERPFQKLLSMAQTYLRRVERAIQQGKTQAELEEMAEMKETNHLLTKAKGVWDERNGFFSLMPQYRELRQFEEIWQGWEQMKDQRKLPSPKLSMQIGQFINKTIIDIVRFYGIEKKK